MRPRMKFYIYLVCLINYVMLCFTVMILIVIILYITHNITHTQKYTTHLKVIRFVLRVRHKTIITILYDIYVC